MASEPVSPTPQLPQQSSSQSDGVQLGYLYAAAGAVLFSTKAIIIKLAYAETISAESLLTLRLGLALPVYLVVGGLALRHRSRRGHDLPPARFVIQSALVGALGFWFASYMDFLGLQYISAQFERLILFTYPLFVVLFGAAFSANLSGRIRSRHSLSVTSDSRLSSRKIFPWRAKGSR
jgi:drug/metabolite transporter (DMT)-like permease